MSKILWEGHALSNDPTFPRAYEASILNPLHYKFLATPLVTQQNNNNYVSQTLYARESQITMPVDRSVSCICD